MRFLCLCLILNLLITACTASNHRYNDTIHYYSTTTQKPYDDVLSELKIAITDQNFRITSHSRVGKVIRQRDNIEFPNYDTIQFCNLTHAKTLLELSPETVRHMPCSVVVYDNGNNVTVTARLLPTDTEDKKVNKFSNRMNSLLREIVDFAVDD